VIVADKSAAAFSCTHKNRGVATELTKGKGREKNHGLEIERTLFRPEHENKQMSHFYQPDMAEHIDSPFVRDGADKLVRRSYWLDMDDRTLVMVMVNGIGANLTNEEKRAHLRDLRRDHLIDQVCVQEILPPED
jgi:hypothetical protein